MEWCSKIRLSRKILPALLVLSMALGLFLPAGLGPASAGATSPPAFIAAQLDQTNRVVTLNFDEALADNSGGSVAGSVYLAADGVNFTALGQNDTVAINNNTLVVTFQNALTGTSNKVRVGAGALRDMFGNVLNSAVTTDALAAGGGGLTFAYTDNDADHIYFNGNSFGVTASGLNLPNGTGVRAALGSMQGVQFVSSKPLFSGMINAGSYYYVNSTVADGSLTVSGTVYNPGNTYLPTGVVGMQIYVDQGGNWQPVGGATPIQPAAGRMAIVGVFIPVGNITASPALDSFTNLYSTEKDITFARSDPNGYTGSIRFSPGLNIIEDINQLDALQQNITLLGAIDVQTGKITYQAGVETASLNFLQNHGASISIEGLPEGLTNINITNTDPTASVLGQSFANGTLTFDVNHFSTYTVRGDPPGSPSFASAATNAAGTKLTATFSKAMANPSGKHTQFAVAVNGSPDAVTAAALNADPAKIDLALTSPVFKGDQITVAYTAGDVQAADGAALVSFTAQAVTNNGPAEITRENVSVDSDNKNLAVTGATPAATVTVPSGVTDAVVNLAALMNSPVGGTVTTNPLPALTIQATTPISQIPVQVAIPAGATVSAASAGNWDGTINVPTVKPNNSVSVTADPGKNASVNAVIEVGYGDVPLTFSKAVRILIPGQAGKDAGYYRGSTFNKITGTCAGDSQTWADANLPAGGEGKIDAGSDLVIWTKHFTRFIAYTQTTSSDAGGGGGGGEPRTEGKAVEKAPELPVEKPAPALKDIAGHWAQSQISRLVAAGAISGYPDGNFKPEARITRAEFATVLVKAFKLQSGTGRVFGDTAGHWARDAVAAAAGRGIVSGYSETAFGPDDPVTREQMAAMIAKAAGPAPASGKVSFADGDEISAWAGDAVATVVGGGIMKGYPGGAFRPGGLATRAEAMVVIVNALK